MNRGPREVEAANRGLVPSVPQRLTQLPIAGKAASFTEPILGQSNVLASTKGVARGKQLLRRNVTRTEGSGLLLLMSPQIALGLPPSTACPFLTSTSIERRFAHIRLLPPTPRRLLLKERRLLDYNYRATQLRSRIPCAFLPLPTRQKIPDNDTAIAPNCRTIRVHRARRGCKYSERTF